MTEFDPVHRPWHIHICEDEENIGTLFEDLDSFVGMPGFDSYLIANTYSAIIISFLCGIHWAVHLFFAEKCPRNLLITSNSVALLAWISLLAKQNEIALLMQIVYFLYLFTLDFKLQKAGILPEWFYELRRNATGIVVLSLIAVIVFS